MALISVIVPVFNVQRYLPECLGSILGQKFGDIEVIAVDGGSDDRSPQILAEQAEADARLHVERKGRVGPGVARNIGIDRAKGDYLWFVDGDDTVADGALEAIACRIRALHPDLLLVGWDSVYPGGRHEAGWGFESLRRATSGAFTVDKALWAVGQTMASWGKVVRREFLLSAGVAFSEQWPHEDVPVSCRVLLAADKVAVVPQVCYHYRKNRPGALMEQTPKHFNIFQSYRSVLEEVRQRAAEGDPRAGPDVQRALFERAIWHYSTIFDSGHAIGGARRRLVPGRLRRSFFSDMHAHFVDYRPAGYRACAGMRGFKFRLIERDAYRAYSVLAPANKLRVAIAHTAGRTRARAGGVGRRLR